MSTEPNIVEAALLIATSVHTGQRDKAGRPYLLHVLRVMHAMDTDEERAVALLHDVIEDSGNSAIVRNAIKDSFGANICDALDILTRKPDQDYLSDYITLIALVGLARKVKIADLYDNLDPHRGGGRTDVDWYRIRKYHRALELLHG